MRLGAVLALATFASACGSKAKGNGDMGGDMGAGACVTNPTTSVELLNACTTAQSGDPAKDAPYFPSLAPGGMLPPLP
ncbi:MAG TPA: hypothetical protein VF945_08760 [Polyangia bacterium]